VEALVSTRGDILRAAAGVLRALPSPGGRTLAVVVRKRLAHDKGFEATRTLVLVPGEERPRFLLFGNRAAVAYPVTVALLQGRDPRTADVDYESDIREDVRKALHKLPLPGVPAVWDVKYEPEPPFNADAWRPKYDASAQRFTFVTDEARSA
jgi:hypothetical protein